MPLFVGALPDEHDEEQTLNQRSVLGMQYSISEAMALTVELPFILRTHSHIDEGRNVSFNLRGLGDIIVGGVFSLLSSPEEYDPSLSVQVGAKLPTGVTDATGSNGEVAEVTIQPGTGSFDGIVGLDYRQGLARAPSLSGEFSIVPLTAGMSYQVGGRGTHGYRLGNVLLVYLGSEYRLLGQVTLLLQANGMFRAHSDVGSTGESPQNTGGAQIFLSPGVKLHLSSAVSVFGNVHVPVYLNVQGIQQTSRVGMQFGASADLDLFP